MSLISTLLTAFTWSSVVLIVILAVVNLFLARRRSWIMAIIRVGITVVSLVLAVVIAKPVSSVITDKAYNMVMPILREKLGDKVDLEGILAATPTGEAGMKVLVSLMVAPLVFLFLFAILRGLLSIPGAIVAATVPVLKKKDKKMQAVSMPVGALNGVLIAFAVLVPVCGFLVVGGHMLTSAADTVRACDSPQMNQMLIDMDTNPGQLADIGEEVEKNPVVVLVYSTLGRPIFGSLTKGTVEAPAPHNRTVSLQLESELGGLIRTGIHLVDVVDSLSKEDYTEADKNKLYLLEESLLDSEWRTMLVTDALTVASSHWRRGEPFAGYKRPTLDANVDPTLNCVLDILSHETDNTLAEDLRDILDVVGDFLMCDLLSSEIDPQQMLITITDSGILTTTMEKLHANPRLSPIADELKALSVRLLSNMLGLEELKNGEHADLMNDVAAEFNNVMHMSEEERHEAVADALGTVFNDYGLEVPADAANQIADQAIAELGSDGEITGDELTDYLINHMDDASTLLPDEIPDDIPDIPLD